MNEELEQLDNAGLGAILSQVTFHAMLLKQRLGMSRIVRPS